MGLLDNHLEQITTSTRAIAALDFPPPKTFTNALIGHHEITTLIRDTEPHERSLFTVDPGMISGHVSNASRRTTVFGIDGSNRRKTISQLQQRQGSAVAKVLGSDMLRRIQQSSRRRQSRSRGVDVEVLLQGAERLCAVHPVAGAKERIASLRTRYSQTMESVSHYESLVLKQQTKLKRINSDLEHDDFSGHEESAIMENTIPTAMTEADLRAEEEDIKELEARKKALEDRVAGIEKDLGGLLR